MQQVKKANGFSLIELMVVVVIMGIIFSWAMPAYKEYVIKTRRADAQASLLGFASAMERFFTSNGNYLGAVGAADANGDMPLPTLYPHEIPVNGDTKYYDLRMVVTTVTYTLFAIPKGDQVGDGALSITSSNLRRWDKADDNTFSSSWQ